MDQANITELKFKRFPIIPELNEEEREELKKSIEDYGYIDPIIINSEMEILDGNHRAAIWNQMGGNKIPVRIVPNHPELDKDEGSKEAFQIRRCLTGRNIRDTDTKYKLIARLSEINTGIAIQRINQSDEVVNGKKERAIRGRIGLLKKIGDTALTAEQIKSGTATVTRAKKYVKKLEQEGKERVDHPEAYIRPKGEPKIPTIDDVCLEIEGYILKATSLLVSKKFKEHFGHLLNERKSGFSQSVRLFAIEIRKLSQHLDLKLLEE